MEKTKSSRIVLIELSSIVILIFVSISCDFIGNKSSELDTLTVPTDVKAEVQNKIEKPIKKELGFNFSDFVIMKNSIGPIKLGMTVKEAESKFVNLKKKLVPVYKFGFDSEELVPTYYYEGSMVFALIVFPLQKKISQIIAVHKDLRTINNLSPQSTIKELKEKYPDLTISISAIDDSESIDDLKNGWTFFFKNNGKPIEPIGDYKGDMYENWSTKKFKTLNRKSDFIMIGKDW